MLLIWKCFAQLLLMGAVHARCVGIGNGCEMCQLPALLGTCLCLNLVSCAWLRVFKS